MAENISMMNSSGTESVDGGTGNHTLENKTLNIAVMASCLIVIFVISIAGNIFVFLVFYKRPSLVTISNRFIVNLSICNFLETICVMPFVFAALVTQDWVFGRFWCQTTGFLMNAIFSASILTLVVISLDRYCAVVTPLHYSMRITPCKSVMMIFIVWLLAIFSAFPPLIGWSHYEYQKNKSVCTVLWTSRNTSDRYYTLCLVLICFILPFIVILWAYSVIFKAAQNNSEKVRKNSLVPNASDDPLQTPIRIERRRSSTAPMLVHRLSLSTRSNNLLWRRDEWKAAVTSCMVVSTFIICWLLYFIIIILESLLDDPDSVGSEVKTLSILLAMSSCAFNPLVYVFRSKVPRVELRTILGLHQKRKEYVQNGVLNCSRRASVNQSIDRSSPCVSRQSSEELEIVDKLRHVSTTTTLTSIIVPEESERSSLSSRT